MTTDTPISVTSEELTELERTEVEAIERAAMKIAQDTDAPLMQAVVDEHLTEIERLAAADLVMLLRHASATALRRSEIERSRIAQAGRRLAAELLDGARKLERYRPDDELPAYLRVDSDVPLTDLMRRQAV